ncbi:uncharacterized protein LOC116926342 [Daphnia magna]|uniref:uncharacterized protein LOC116926342 n=1 Tax=Daphnia magna TaxID=35525 RepID=UPI001E1BB8AE|nr:uncharacterized protein LOC116926342 [Daphnia magna]
MNSFVPMSMPYSGAPMSYAPPPPSYAPPSYAPPSYATSADYAAPQTAPIQLTPLVIPNDADALGGGGGGGGGGSITKFFALPLIVVLPILLPFLVILFFLPKFGKKPTKDKKEYEDMKPYYDDQEYDNSYMDDKPYKDSRKRRQADSKNISSSSSGLPSMSTAQVDRLTDVVFAAINSQECIQRLLCEAGSLSRSFSDTAQMMTKAVKEFVPNSIKNSYDVFAKAEKCEQYKCGSLDVRK